MSPKEFLENALGVTLFLVAGLAGLGVVVVVLGSVPLLLALFPLSAMLLAIVLLIAYLRHRRLRRGSRRPSYEDELDDRRR